MKLRIKGNSLRLRLTQSEVEKIKNKMVVCEIIQFSPTKELFYSIEGDDEVANITADFNGIGILVKVPREQVKRWADSDQVGLSEECMLGSNESLSLLIEKDFTCLKPRVGDDDLDTFPHPEG